MSAITAPTTPPQAVSAAPRLSVEEFVARHNGDYVELVNGIVKELPVAGLNHGRICARMTRFLDVHVEDKDLGQVMSNDSFVRTGPDNVRGADVLYYSYERLPKGAPVPTGFHTVAPELVVEVKSPSDRWNDVFAKVVEYLNTGVRVVVLLDPVTATASIYRPDELQRILDNGDELTLPDILPGFAVPVRRLFA